MQALAIGHTLEDDLSPKTDGELNRFFFENLVNYKGGTISKYLQHSRIEDVQARDPR